MEQGDREQRFPIDNALIRQLRQDRRLSQEEVAQKIGISAKTLAMFENGGYDSIGSQDRVNRCRNLGDIAQYYGLSDWKALTLSSEAAAMAADEGSAQIENRGSIEVEAPGRGFNPGWYVQRPAQQTEMLEALNAAGVPIIVQGASGLGKSQLCAWLTHRLSQRKPPEISLVSFSFQLGTFSNEELSDLRLLLSSIGRRFLRLLDVDSAEERLATAWQRPGGEKDKLTWLMEQFVLAAMPIT